MGPPLSALLISNVGLLTALGQILPDKGHLWEGAEKEQGRGRARQGQGSAGGSLTSEGGHSGEGEGAWA